ncbi:MAG TPA: NAD(P)(+) transhydrogenase (Re/Si-specific) subunit alpha [Bacteroidetes bacterium]|nr:NAD(P)(+) transhydrogenase (Re/Si-specific) subunit alpha [Bacteroidota bacterium]
MKFGVVSETGPRERRVATVPSVVAKLIAAGHTVHIEQGAGLRAGFDDEMYRTQGASVLTRSDVLTQSECLLRVAVPNADEINELRAGQTLVSYIYPKRHADVLASLAASGVHVFAMDALPRITRAQTMDVLSSQNNLAGYKAVVIGAAELGRIFPLMMTAAGTVPPAKVLIYGAGVAGLQAIATARRLGAQVEVTDVRPETKEQVESLGAKFIAVEGLDQVNVQGGYVAAIGQDVLERQKVAVEKSLTAADLVICTALVTGGTAPTLITTDQVSRMKRGAVIIDMAAEAGGNCELTKADVRIEHGGVLVLGPTDLASSAAQNASELYAKNVLAFLAHVATSDGFAFDVADEITSATLVAHNGQVRT